MNRRRQALTVFGLLCGVSAVGAMLRPQERSRKTAPDFLLTDLVPKQFNGWRELPRQVTTVNPQTQELLDKLYSQILERTYVNADGYVIMLAIAYGADQRGSLEAHKPEVCYPAQGFVVKQNIDGEVNTSYGSIPVKQLDTVSGTRHEPLTYWFVVANNAVQSKVDKRMVELRLILTGQIADGMLFRVSSIDQNKVVAWQKQQDFIRNLLAAVPKETRSRLAGLNT